MPLASYILSLCLHAAVILFIWLAPSWTPPVNLSQPVLISLVEGDVGGNDTPSPILGPMGDEGGEEIAPAPAAEQAEVAQTAREESKALDVPQPDAVPVPEPKKPDLQPEPKPEVKPEPKKEEEKPVVKKQEKKPEPKKEEKKPEPKKKEEKKPKKEDDSVKAALEQAKRKATSRSSSADKGSAVEKALGEARKNAGGRRGGGGGRGAGPGGGGMYNVYTGQVMLAVRPNWGYASSTRANLQCTVLIDVSPTGEVQTCKIDKSSGNVQFDASCVNAIKRTSQAGDFPPPPSPEYQQLEMVFSFDELTRR